ncbi:probable sarcosine oxidase isoform X2 [Musa acuminata AAA Group]|uniref:probable sarcosine oxidase isoform X2 n=1 Tax=Musa acuminata AAA Group TaxID=214697 RepID=UPI0031E11359
MMGERLLVRGTRELGLKSLHIINLSDDPSVGRSGVLLLTCSLKHQSESFSQWWNHPSNWFSGIHRDSIRHLLLQRIYCSNTSGNHPAAAEREVCREEAAAMEPCGDQFDVVVVGAGIMGSCAAYEAAKRGCSVLLLEQFDFLHQLGSSHGESRTIRATYPEEYYPPMVLEAHRLWEAAQSEAGYRVLTRTPHFDMGPADNRSLRSVIASCERQSSVNVRLLDRAAVDEMFSGTFRLPEGWIGVRSDAGGVIKPTKAVAMFQALAIRRGAVLKDHMEVTGIKKDEEDRGVRVSTATGDSFLGKKCVVTVGPWSSKLVKAVSGHVLPIQPLHTTICYWKIKEGHEHEMTPEGGFPTFASYGEIYVYGTPSMEFPGLIKIGLHGGRPCDPDRRDWTSNSGMLVDAVGSWIDQMLPGKVETDKPVIIQSCMYSMTPDEDFVIDFLGGELGKDVVVAGGFSGHGFKMGPVVGRTLAELAIDGAADGVELKHFRLGRFTEDSNGNAKDFDDQVSSHLHQ